MKLTVNQMLDLIGTQVLSEAPDGFGRNGFLRRLSQLRDATNAIGSMPIAIPKPTMSEEGKAALKAPSRGRRGSRKKAAEGKTS